MTETLVEKIKQKAFMGKGGVQNIRLHDILKILAVHREKLQELADLLKKPLPLSREYAVEPHEHLKIVERNLQNLNDQFDKARKKFGEMEKEEK